MFEIIGFALAVAAALDFAVKRRTKLRIASSIRMFGQSDFSNEQRGHKFIDDIFGNALISKRSVLISIFLSCASLVIAYLYAFLTSDYELIWIFDYRPSWISFVFFFVFFCGSLLGDVVSYAQTRIFLRTVDQYRVGIVSFGMALADAVISVALFVLIFSFTRLFAYMIIVAGFSSGQLVSTQVVNLDLLSEAMPTLEERGLIRAGEADWLEYLASANKDDESTIDSTLKAYNERVVGPFGDGKEFSLEATIGCAPLGSERMSGRDTVTLLAKSVAGQRGYGELDREYGNIFEDISEQTKSWSVDIAEVEDVECAYRVLVIQRTMTPGRLLDIAGPNNAWWAAFQMTAEGAYQSIAFKFAPYVHIDPFHDIDEFYESVTFQSGYSLFDLTFADPTIPYLLSEFRYEIPKDAERLRVPYSPMLGSALAVSIIFWIYILSTYGSRGFNLLGRLVGKATAKLDTRAAPLTALVLVVAGAWVAMEFVFWSLGQVWRTIF